MTATPSRELSSGRRFKAYTSRHLDELTLRAGLDPVERLAVRAVAEVLPFRVNDYVIEELIDWSAAPDDPIYRLVFPQPDMLPPDDVARLSKLLRAGAAKSELNAAALEVRAQLNPHPAGQLVLNVPSDGHDELAGVQHKYAETALLFPKQAQTCHAYCTYCFRWAQFVGDPELKMATTEIARFVAYVRANPEITSVLLTGGDPMMMGHTVLARYIEPLLQIEQLESIRIGTKALTYWPQRWVGDPDAQETLRLFEKVSSAGKALSVMAHFSHPRELEPDLVKESVRRIQATGAVIRTQAPLIRGINDDADIWSTMWRTQHRMGMVPYYMFVERDTGPRAYFEVSLARALEIFSSAYRTVAGPCRTVRGPSMSATPGKVAVDGITEINGERVFILHFIQARDSSLVNRPFFAKYSETAAWLNQLEPVPGLPWLLEQSS